MSTPLPAGTQLFSKKRKQRLEPDALTAPRGIAPDSVSDALTAAYHVDYECPRDPPPMPHHTALTAPRGIAPDCAGDAFAYSAHAPPDQNSEQLRLILEASANKSTFIYVAPSQAVQAAALPLPQRSSTFAVPTAPPRVARRPPTTSRLPTAPALKIAPPASPASDASSSDQLSDASTSSAPSTKSAHRRVRARALARRNDPALQLILDRMDQIEQRIPGPSNPAQPAAETPATPATLPSTLPPALGLNPTNPPPPPNDLAGTRPLQAAAPRPAQRHGTTTPSPATPASPQPPAPRHRLDFPENRHRSRDRSPPRRHRSGQPASRSPPPRSPDRRRFPQLEFTSSSRSIPDTSRWRQPSRSRSPRRDWRAAQSPRTSDTRDDRRRPPPSYNSGPGATARPLRDPRSASPRRRGAAPPYTSILDRPLPQPLPPAYTPFMDAVLAARSPAGTYFPTTALPRSTAPPPATGSDAASRIRDDPEVQKLADALIKRLNHHRSATDPAASSAGMPDVCQTLADRNAITHALQHQPNPAAAPSPPPPPPAPGTADPPAPPISGSPTDSDLGDVTNNFLGINRPIAAPAGQRVTPLPSKRLSISAQRAAPMAAQTAPPAPAPLPSPGPPPITTNHSPPPRSPSADFRPPPGLPAPAALLGDLAPTQLQFLNDPDNK